MSIIFFEHLKAEVKIYCSKAGHADVIYIMETTCSGSILLIFCLFHESSSLLERTTFEGDLRNQDNLSVNKVCIKTGEWSGCGQMKQTWKIGYKRQQLLAKFLQDCSTVCHDKINRQQCKDKGVIGKGLTILNSHGNDATWYTERNTYTIQGDLLDMLFVGVPSKSSTTVVLW